jgi:uncharacterized protein with beta-barrel porin domain
LIALAQVAAAGVANATAGPCSLDATNPGTFVYTCAGTIATSADNTSAVSYSTAAGNAGTYSYPGFAGNNLTVNSTATISTDGAASHGIAAHSAGGRGGNAQSSYVHVVSGGLGGAGGTVTVTNGGTITTRGAGSHGISATSRGGDAGSWALSSFDDLGLGGAGGRAGDVTVTNNGTITTNGEAAHGIYAVSTAGASNSYGGSVPGGTAGNVAVTSAGTITTNGNNSIGIYASTAFGNVTVTASGDILAQGANNTGIKAESSSGNVTVTSNGNITAGHSSSFAINAHAAGGNATVDIGPNSIVSGGNRAIIASASNVATINNSGLVRGGIYISSSSATFNNLAGGIFESGSSVSPNGTTLNNAGTVSPGGNGTVQTTTLTGNFVQTSTGVLKVDADWTGNGGAGTADFLEVTGTATLAGTVIVNPLNFPKTGGLNKTFTVLKAYGGITNDGITIGNTAAVNYALLFPDTNTMNVQATINFQGVGLDTLNPNQNGVGRNLNQIFGGGTHLPFMTPLMQLPTGGQLGGALNQLAPIGDGGSFSTAMTTGSQFGQQLLSCRVAGEEGDANRFIREGQCVWARVNARRFDNDGRADGVGYRENALFYSAGAQLAVAQNWQIGAGLGYETMNLSTASNASSEGERLHLGGVVKYTPGPWLMAASVTGGWGWHDNRRHVSFGGFGATATSSSDSSFAAARLTAAYLMSRGMFYAKPQVEFAATHLMRDSYREQGTGGIALAVGKVSDTVLSFSPSLELGVEQRGANGFVTRAFVKGGATFRDTDTFVTTATFANAPGVPAFAISSKVDRMVADIGAGLDLISAAGSALRLQYDGQFGERTTQHSGGAKLQFRF